MTQPAATPTQRNSAARLAPTRRPQRHKRADKRPRLLRDARGMSTVEYIILLAFISIGCIAGWKRFGDNIRGALTEAEGAASDIQTGAQNGRSGTP